MNHTLFHMHERKLHSSTKTLRHEEEVPQYPGNKSLYITDCVLNQTANKSSRPASRQ